MIELTNAGAREFGQLLSTVIIPVAIAAYIAYRMMRPTKEETEDE